jgi:hypothetical protein
LWVSEQVPAPSVRVAKAGQQRRPPPFPEILGLVDHDGVVHGAEDPGGLLEQVGEFNLEVGRVVRRLLDRSQGESRPLRHEVAQPVEVDDLQPIDPRAALHKMGGEALVEARQQRGEAGLGETLR